eukprot:362057-Chlamydomonas_euryale.AAC.17
MSMSRACRVPVSPHIHVCAALAVFLLHGTGSFLASLLFPHTCAAGRGRAAMPAANAAHAPHERLQAATCPPPPLSHPAHSGCFVIRPLMQQLPRCILCVCVACRQRASHDVRQAAAAATVRAVSFLCSDRQHASHDVRQAAAADTVRAVPFLCSDRQRASHDVRQAAAAATVRAVSFLCSDRQRPAQVGPALRACRAADPGHTNAPNA